MSTLSDERKRYIAAQSYDMQGHAQKCVELCSQCARTTVDQLRNVYTRCLDDHQIKPEALESI